MNGFGWRDREVGVGGSRGNGGWWRERGGVLGVRRVNRVHVEVNGTGMLVKGVVWRCGIR